VRFVIYKDKKGEWRWQLRARNGKIVADSAEGDVQRHMARRRVEALIDAVVRGCRIEESDS